MGGGEGCGTAGMPSLLVGLTRVGSVILWRCALGRDAVRLLNRE